MNKSLFVALMLFWASTNAQTYAFDFLTKYKLKTDNSKNDRESVNYFNSDDFSYHLRLMKSPDAFRALLTDRGRMLAHRFTVAETKVKGEIFFTFNYDSSFKLNGIATKNRIEFTQIPGSDRQILLKKYNSKKSKKPFSVQLLTLGPANKNLFKTYGISHSSEIGYDLEYPGNYIVTRAEIIDGKEKCEFILDEYRNVELELILPNDLKLR